MKTLKLFALGTITFVFMQACKLEPKTTDMEDMHHPASFEVNNVRDTINLLYADSSREGHWIVQHWTAETGRVKSEEGYYKTIKNKVSGNSTTKMAV